MAVIIQRRHDKHDSYAKKCVRGCLAAFLFLGLLTGPAYAEWVTFAGRGIRIDLPNVPLEHTYAVIDDDGAIILKVTSGTFLEKPDESASAILERLWLAITPKVPGSVVKQDIPNCGAFKVREFIWDSPMASFVVRCRIYVHEREFRIVLIKGPQDLNPDYWHKIVDSVYLEGGKIVMRGIK